MKTKIFYGILFIFLLTATTSFAIGGIPPVGGYTPELQEIDPDCSLGDLDCFVDLDHQGYTDNGTRVGGDLVTTIGDYDDSANATKLIANDLLERITLDADQIYFATDESSTPYFNATFFQNQTEDPSLGGRLANKVFISERTANPSGTGDYYGDVRAVRNSSNDNETGTVGLNIGTYKSGIMDSDYLYGTDFTTRLDGGGNTDFLVGHVNRVRLEGSNPSNIGTIVRGHSTDVRIDNPNSTVPFVQGNHPTVDMRQGTIGGATNMFMDFDVSTANLGSTLNFTGDVTYLQGGGGGDVISLKQHLDNEGHKLRFIWNQGEIESDFAGIINYTGDVSNIESASDKVLINKEWFSLNNNKTTSYTVSTLPAGSAGDIAHVTDASAISYRGVATGGGSDTALVFFDGTNWLYH